MSQGHLRDLSQDHSPVAQITVDSRGDLVSANAEARRLFGLKSGDVGRPLRDLELSYRPLELRSRIDEATAEKRIVQVGGVEWRAAGGDTRLLDVHVSPLFEAGDKVAGVSVGFADVTRYLELQRDLEHSRQDLETAYEELQSANEELQTTNEELQSTVEELETTNEELQSSNEELETMNEELESTNNELQTINSDLQENTTAFDSFRNLTDSIFAGMKMAVIALDLDFKVRLWNEGAEELWGMRAQEAIGELFFGLDIGLPAGELREAVKASAAEGGKSVELTVDATNRRGKATRCRVRSVPVKADGGQRGVALLIEQL